MRDMKEKVGCVTDLGIIIALGILGGVISPESWNPAVGPAIGVMSGVVIGAVTELNRKLSGVEEKYRSRNTSGMPGSGGKYL